MELNVTMWLAFSMMALAMLSLHCTGQLLPQTLVLSNKTAASTQSSKYLPLYKCNSSAQTKALKQRFSQSPLPQDGSNCPTWGYFIAALYRADPRPDDKLMVSVGFCKGYNAVQFLGVWGTVSSKALTFDNWAKQLSAMHDQNRVVSEYVCGQCKECLDRLYLLPNVLPPRIDALALRDAQEQRSLNISQSRLTLPHFIGIDANPRNVHSLHRIARTYALPIMAINVLVSNQTAPDIWLEPQHWGDDSPFLLPVPADAPEATPVPVRSLDDVMAELHTNETLSIARPISILAIDTGMDQEVLRGAESLLRSRRVRVLIFTWAGTWAPGRTLQTVVQDVAEVGAMSCYLLGSSKVWKLTSGCWDGVYGQRRGGNVACVRSGDVWERVLDSLCVRVRAKDLWGRPQFV